MSDRPPLEDVLRQKAEDNALGRMNIVKSDQGWQANHQKPGADGWNVCVDDDPAEAIYQLFDPPPVYEPEDDGDNIGADLI